ncbi:MAG TPA: hypothetical protein VNW23_02685 [Opitutaceae bacterium]|nr:hypothetical protein [Opitutaceae bacterium]
MKFSLTLQTLVLVVLTLVLTGVTAVWGTIVYRSLYDTILHGFDQKLQALCGSAAAFTDGEAHAAYQRRRIITSLLPGPDGKLLGCDGETGELVVIDPADGGSIPLGAPAGGRLRGLAWTGGDRLYGLSGDGRSLQIFDSRTGKVLGGQSLASPLDALFSANGHLCGWRGRSLYQIDPALGTVGSMNVTLAHEVGSLASAPAPATYAGLSTDGTKLWFFDSAGKILLELALHAAPASSDGAAVASPAPAEAQPPPPLQALAIVAGQFWAAGPSLVRIDSQTGQVQADFSPGYFTEQHPFYSRYIGAYRSVQKAAGLTYLYTQVYLGGNKIYYGLDGTVGKDHSPPGSADVLPDPSIAGAQQVQFLGQPWDSPIQHWALWGLLKSGFAPIFDAGGKVVAMSGADVDITIILEKTHWALFAVLFVGVGTFAAGGMVSFKVAQGLTRPLRQIKDSALWIAAGYYGAGAEAPRTREIATLAGTLNALSARLQEQEKRSRAYQKQLFDERSRASLQRALVDFSTTTSAGFPAGVSVRRLASGRAASALSGTCWQPAGGLLWLGESGADSLAAACWQARATSLARTLLTQAGSEMQPEKILESMLAGVPGVAAVAYWRADSRTLHVRAVRETHLLLAKPAGEVSLVSCKGEARVVVPAGQTLAWMDAAGVIAATDADPLTVIAKQAAFGTTEFFDGLIRHFEKSSRPGPHQVVCLGQPTA